MDGKREIWAGSRQMTERIGQKQEPSTFAGLLTIHVLGSADDLTTDDTAFQSSICQGWLSD